MGSSSSGMSSKSIPSGTVLAQAPIPCHLAHYNSLASCSEPPSTIFWFPQSYHETLLVEDAVRMLLYINPKLTHIPIHVPSHILGQFFPFPAHPPCCPTPCSNPSLLSTWSCKAWLHTTSLGKTSCPLSFLGKINCSILWVFCQGASCKLAHLVPSYRAAVPTQHPLLCLRSEGRDPTVFPSVIPLHLSNPSK